MNSNGVFFFKFNDVGGCSQVVEQGPLMIRGVPLFVAQWDPTKGLTKPIHTSCPLWIKLHNIPLVAFNKEGISRIASALGVPKQMDACTASMCDKSWGRPSFAKVLVEVWAVGELKKELEVVIPDVNGGDDSRVRIRVEYIWEPSQCSHCLVFGHKLASCAKAVASQQKQKKSSKVIDSEGFVTVEKRQWRPKNVDQPSSSGSKLDDGNVIVDTAIHIEKAPIAEATSNLELGVQHSLSMEKIPVEVVHTTEPKQTTVDVNKGSDRGKGVQSTKPVQSFVKPLDVPVRSILKNPNRFSVLDHEGGTGTEGGKKDSTGKTKRSSPTQPPGGGIPKARINGLNSSSKQSEVRDLIKEKGINICALLETHVKVDSLASVCTKVFGRWSWVSNHSHSDFGTRIIVAWDDSVFDIMLSMLSFIW
ncbi:hypothetical protein OSB04_028484 [Centaurea solstitialis]|uniref:DUF4283 domain-containing protein n=1 Tax=Centaurea solstitialis TaxID=347529 RepID=A0AA38SGK4_9ASTR|nr:hypothetical protein OSB04_028484 [Centaurea solstitialis]